MPGYVQLETAARQAGKSEVTLRRLVKAGKISHRKEKTLTGFVYLVDPAEVLAYYGRPEAQEETDDEPIVASEPDTEPTTEEGKPPRQIRVAVAGESGSLGEYWQKRAEMYEDRYHHEVAKQSQLREELGIWRGRAEQAQNMVMKLLPAPAEESVKPTAPTPAGGFPWGMVAFILSLIGLLIAIGALGYVFLQRP